MTHVRTSNTQLDKIAKIRNKIRGINRGQVPCSTPIQARRIRRLGDPIFGEDMSWTRFHARVSVEQTDSNTGRVDRQFQQPDLPLSSTSPPSPPYIFWPLINSSRGCSHTSAPSDTPTDRAARQFPKAEDTYKAQSDTQRYHVFPSWSIQDRRPRPSTQTASHRRNTHRQRRF